jgi:hypothetical protein
MKPPVPGASGASPECPWCLPGRSAGQVSWVGAGPAGPGGSVSGVKPARRLGAHMDAESAAWLSRLDAEGTEGWAAEHELHAKLVRLALVEVRRRAASTPVPV